MPLDLFIESPAAVMAPQQGSVMPPAGEEVVAAAADTVAKHSPGVSLTPVERFKFYDDARRAYAVVQTLERRPCKFLCLLRNTLALNTYACACSCVIYIICGVADGNVLLQKGVIGPDGADLRP